MTTLTPWSDMVDQAITYLKKSDTVIAGAIEQVGPCRLAPNPNVYETLVDAIVSQQISVKAADAIMARLRAALPERLITPEALIQLDHEALRAAGLSNSKARYVRDLTERIAGGELNIEELGELDDETVIEKLVAVKGIGRWTAEMCLIFTFGRPDVLPVDDLGFVEGVRQAYGLEARPTRKEMLERGEAWRPYRTFATWYIWGLRRIVQKNERARTRIVSL